MKSAKRIILGVITIILCFCSLYTMSFALEGDGYAGGGGGQGTAAGGRSCNVLYTSSDAEIGYRFSVMQKSPSGDYECVGSIDVYKASRLNVATSNYYYHVKATLDGVSLRNVDKYTYKNNHQYMVLNYEKTPTTTNMTNNAAYKFCSDSSLGIALPENTSDMTTWGTTENKLEKVLPYCGVSNGVAGLSTNNYVTIEPIYAVQLLGTRYSCTVTEMAVIGFREFGSTGTVANYMIPADNGWNFITKYANCLYPSSLYTNNKEHMDIPIGRNLVNTADSPSYSTDKGYTTSFDNIINKGYGLMVVWDENWGFKPSVNLFLNDYGWTDTSTRNNNGITIKLKNESTNTIYNTENTTANVFKPTSTIPSGRYSVLASISDSETLVDTGHGMTVTSNDSFVNLNYYTIEVKKETGVNNAYAVCNKNTVTTTINAGNSKNVLGSSSVTLNATTATGYHWDRWSWTSYRYGNASSDFSNEASYVLSNVLMYRYIVTAKAIPNAYTVKYYLDGSLYKTQNCTYGVADNYYALPTKSGYSIDGWYAGSSASNKGTHYTPGGGFRNLTTVNGGVVNRYAYSSAQYTVEYYDFDNSLLASDKYNIGTNGTHRALPVFDLPGYYYTGWYENDARTGTTHAGNTPITSPTNAGTIVRRYAKLDMHKLTINYYSNGGTCTVESPAHNTGNTTGLIGTDTLYYHDNLIVNSYSTYASEYYDLTMTKTGNYGTGCWNTKVDGSGISMKELTRYEEAGEFATAMGGDLSTRDMTVNLYAQWEPITYKVNFYLIDTTATDPTPTLLATQNCTYGLTYSYNSLPTFTGYNVDGWYENGSWDSKGTKYAQNTSFGNLTAINGDVIERYAYKVANSYTVKYHVGVMGSGSFEELTELRQVCLVGETYNYVKVPLYGEGYAVDGWYAQNWNKNLKYQGESSFTNITMTNGAVVNRYAFLERRTGVLTINYHTPEGGYCDANAMGNTTGNATGLIRSITVPYSSTIFSSEGLINYKDDKDPLYITKMGYTGNGYWETSDGAYKIEEDECYESSQSLAAAFGVTFDGTADVTLNIYAKLVPNSLTVLFFQLEDAPCNTSSGLRFQENLGVGNAIAEFGSFYNNTTYQYVTTEDMQNELEAISDSGNGDTYVFDKHFATDAIPGYTEPSDEFYMAKTGYHGTGYWSGYVVMESIADSLSDIDIKLHKIAEGSTFVNTQDLAAHFDFDLSHADSIFLTPEFEPNTYTVEYYLDGEFVSSQECVYDSESSYAPIPVVEGKVISNWYENPDKTGNQYYAGEKFGNLTDKNGGIVKRYAFTETNSYVVNYYLDGVELTMLRQVCSMGTPAYYKILVEKTGYTVDGWYENSTGASGTKYDSGRLIDEPTAGVIEINRYAYSTANHYTVKYYLDGVEQPNLQQNCVFDEIYNYAMLPDTGNRLVNGWFENNTSASGTKHMEGSSYSNLTDVNNDIVNRYAYTVSASDYNVLVHLRLDGKPWKDAPTFSVSVKRDTFLGATKTLSEIGAGVYGYKGSIKADDYFVRINGVAVENRIIYKEAFAVNIEAGSMYITSSGTNTYYIDFYTVSLANGEGIESSEMSVLHNNKIVKRFDADTEVQVLKGSAVSLDSAIPKDHYFFDKWTWDKTNCTTNAITAENSAEIPHVLTDNLNDRYDVTAQADAKKYTVNYYLDNTLLGDLTQTCIFGEDYLYEELPEKTGYKIAGWYDNAEYTGIVYSSRDSIAAPSGDANVINMYAYSIANHYTVKYYFDGELLEDLTQYCLYNETHSYKMLPEKIGYIVDGWYENSSAASGTKYAEGSVFDNLSSTDGAVINRYAYSTPVKYNIVFDKNASDAAGSTASMVLSFNELKALTKNGFTRTGYTFDRWNSNPDNTGISYNDKQEVTNLACEDGATVILYAQWKPITYQVKYYLDGELLDGLTQNCVYGTENRYLDIPSKTGYNVDGWYENSTAATGTKYNVGEVIVAPVIDGTIINRYAYSTPIKYNIVFDKNASTATGSTASMVLGFDETKKLTKNGFMWTGYVFTGWNSMSDGSGTSYGDEQEVVNLAYEDGATVTLYAQWRQKTYTVKYYLDGVEQTELEQRCGYDYTYKYKPLPIKEGYDVDGWFENSSEASGPRHNEGESFSNLAATNSAVIYRYAYSTSKSYTITYKWNDGTTITGLTPTTYTYGKGAVLPFVPELAGFVTSGWYATSDCNGIEITTVSTTETGDKVFYARKTEFTGRFELWFNLDNEEWTDVYDSLITFPYLKSTESEDVYELIPGVEEDSDTLSMYFIDVPYGEYDIYANYSGSLAVQSHDIGEPDIVIGHITIDSEFTSFTADYYSVTVIPMEGIIDVAGDSSFGQEEYIMGGVDESPYIYYKGFSIDDCVVANRDIEDGYSWGYFELEYNGSTTKHGGTEEYNYVIWEDCISSLEHPAIIRAYTKAPGYTVYYYKQVTANTSDYELADKEVCEGTPETIVTVTPQHSYYSYYGSHTVIKFKDDSHEVITVPGTPTVSMYISKTEDSSVSFYFNKNVNDCTLTYVMNGGTYDGSPNNYVQRCGLLEKVTLITPTREGYTFTGWYLSVNDRNYAGYVGMDGDNYVVKGDTVVYATWKEIQPTIEIVANTINGDVMAGYGMTASATVINRGSGDLTPANPAYVKLVVKDASDNALFTSTTTTVVPANNKNLVYFNIPGEKIPESLADRSKLSFVWDVSLVPFN